MNAAKTMSRALADNARGPGAAARAVFECEFAFGQPDILVSKAAMMQPIGAIPETPPEEFAKRLQANVTGPFALIRAAWPLLQKSQGRIVNVLSGASRMALFGGPMCYASKAALLMLTRSVDLEGKPRGIRRFGFAPGLVDTGMRQVMRDSGVNEVSQLPRFALSPPEIPARAIARLASSQADDLAGQYSGARDSDRQKRAGLEAK